MDGFHQKVLSGELFELIVECQAAEHNNSNEDEQNGTAIVQIIKASKVVSQESMREARRSF